MCIPFELKSILPLCRCLQSYCPLLHLTRQRFLSFQRLILPFSSSLQSRVALQFFPILRQPVYHHMPSSSFNLIHMFLPGLSPLTTLIDQGGEKRLKAYHVTKHQFITFHFYNGSKQRPFVTHSLQNLIIRCPFRPRYSPSSPLSPHLNSLLQGSSSPFSSKPTFRSNSCTYSK